jgi:hypothetical protein
VTGVVRRPSRPDLDPGDRVLVVAHRWLDTPGGPMWLPSGGYRWRLVGRVVWDSWAGWQIETDPEAPHHPSREQARHVVAVLRTNPRRPVPSVQLDLFGVPL